MSEQTVLQRLSNWLHMTLYTEIIDYPMEGNSPRAEYLLQLLIDFTDFLQESIPVCELFLTKYLYTWNGSDYRPYILQLITRFRIWPFEKMNDLLLEPLRKLFFCSSVYFKCQVLYSFTTLLRNFVSIEWPRYKGRPDGDGGNIAGSALDINETFAFGEPLGEFSAMNTITEFIGFVDSLCALGLLVEGSNSLLLHHSLAFYELVSKIHTVYNFPYVCLPSEGIALRAMYSSDAMVLSRICQLLCNYKKEIDHLKTLQDDEHATASMAIIPQMNSYILHLCNLLWRGKAFHADSLLSVTAKDVPQLDLSDYNSIFSIWEHPALQWCASLYDIESGGAPQDKNTAKEYLNYLQSLQLGGIDTFLTTYIQRYAKKSP
ncbi:centromere protein I-like [Ptychodera flava]|uniref:centromere protein I-like n=1 Tax=Ptychodera flava TaxID=63121 RepID=UPI003969DE0F